ncbi:Zinc finger, SWIM-type [Dillenia turbinata]|uniref:Zinc finger, SWIM-type n=1 Tax=Dillenia turbinata TaxID=194707 RepID=A0AAN8V998_9MAGN
MDSESSNASTSDPHPHHRPARSHTRQCPIQPFANRIMRAVRHRLLLLHRSEANFFVLGATGNVYTVTLATTPTCSCPDRITPCKHILFIFIRVLGVSLDDACMRRGSLRPRQLNRLLSTPSSPEYLAGPTLRERFLQLFHATRGDVSRPQIEVEEGTICPVCLEGMGKLGGKIVACRTCRNPIHEECMLRWKRSMGRRSASCVICRARWRDVADQEKYLNLAAFVKEADVDGGERSGTRCGGN